MDLSNLGSFVALNFDDGGSLSGGDDDDDMVGRSMDLKL